MSLFWSYFYFFMGLSYSFINIVIKYLYNQNKYWALQRYQFDVLSFNNRAHVLFSEDELLEPADHSDWQNIQEHLKLSSLHCTASARFAVGKEPLRQAVQSSNSDLQLLLSSSPFHRALCSFFMLFMVLSLETSPSLTANEHNSVQWSAPLLSENLKQVNERE